MQKKNNTGQYNFISFLKYFADNQFQFENIDMDFFIAMLEAGKAVVLFDGLDEIVSEEGRLEISKSILNFSRKYTDCPIWVTSRIVGYTKDVKLNQEIFQHYYLAEVSEPQAKLFIQKWYEIQILKNSDLLLERIESLQKAVEENIGVRKLRSNPLLLTMMTLVHQFEGTLPDDRAKLYDKCIELLLKTWQEQRFKAIYMQSPLEQRGIKYDEQLELLAAVSFYMQNKKNLKNDDSRGLIEEKELEMILFEKRNDIRRRTESETKEDIRIFIDYIREHAGLFIEKGLNEKKQNLFAFVHLSFLEYLCAYRITDDKSKTPEQNIEFLIEHIEHPAWQEVILLALYLSNTSFLDLFFCEVKRKEDFKNRQEVWQLLGRAVRDNLNFANEDIKIIITKLLDFWLDLKKRTDAAAVLKEIRRFSNQKIIALNKDVFYDEIKNRNADSAFSLINFYIELFEKTDKELFDSITKNQDLSKLFSYLPFFKNEPDIINFTRKNASLENLIIFFDSMSGNTENIIFNILQKPLSANEIQGFYFSSLKSILHFLL